MFTTNSLCLIICPIHEWPLFLSIFKVIFLLSPFDKLHHSLFYLVWTYGIELWGCASHSNIEITQRYQSKILRTLTNAPRYVTNHTLHSELHIPYVREVFRERMATHRTAIASHPNPPHGPTSTRAAHQTSETTKDTRRDTVRRRHWTHP
jgi:hypothetical protein